MTKISNQYSLTNILTADLANSRLGINNVSPAYSLDLTGTARVSGNVGISATPSAWISTAKALQLNNTASLFAPSSEAILGNNIFVDSTDNNKYITTNFASMYRQVDGKHLFYSAASGTAGTTISFGTPKLTILSDGNVGIGTGSPTDFLDATFGLSIIASSGRSGLSLGSTQGTANEVLSRLSFTNTNSTNAGGKRLAYISGIRGTTNNSAYLEFGTANDGLGTQRMVISQTGNVGIGTDSPSAISTYTTLDIRGATGGGIRMGVAGNSTPFNLQQAGTDAYLNNVANGAMYFLTNDVERMRITNGGVVQISNAGDAQLHINASGATGYVKYDNSSSDTWGTGIGFNIATNFELYNFTTATYGFRVTRSGIYGTTVSSPRSVFVQSDGTLGGISSVRESKTNIASLDSSWLMQLNPVSFNYRKKDAEDKYTNEHYDELYYGLIAEEAELVNKEICTYNDNKLIGIEYSKLVPVLVKAIQELSAKVSLLENK